jgi:predicted PurR-regulated permease PerM
MSKTERLLLATAIAVVAIFIYLLNAASSVFMPLLVAFILAYALEPVVAKLVAWRVSRVPAIAIVLTCTVLAAILAVLALYIPLQNEFQNVRTSLPGYAVNFYELMPPRLKTILAIETPEKLNMQLDVALDKLQGISFSILKETLLVLQKAFSSTISFIIGVIGYFITPVYLFYFLKDMPAIREKLVNLVPCRHRPHFENKLSEIDDLLSGFIRGQLSVCAILAVLYSIGLYLIGIDLAIVIGTFAGLAFIIPYAGTIIGIILSVLMALLKFHDLLHPLLCIAWFGLVQALEGAIITPKIVGDKVGIHPVVAILALFIGGQFWGVFGMLLAVPVAAILKVFLTSLVSLYRETPFFGSEQ